MENQSIFNEFKLLKQYDYVAFYNNQGPFINSNIKRIMILIGESNSKPYSTPTEIIHHLNEYNKLGVEVIDKTSYVMKISDIKSNFIHEMDIYKKYNNQSTWYNLPTELVQKFLIEQIRAPEAKEEYGCYCEICGEYDKYAIAKNGKGLCYKHMKF